ncbi:thiamine-monophosphate kinase [Desulfolithobacter dissulfuricans]|uniref:Thiamine-monophosphate kinase n=1 Tax=Desulfolithobacter dissulfuricans TaxID=2795293 RepID=A0A915U0N3_9BACT|nr:thiamine-phosphate kinase [Desulfolithobacter dissulfuricans]BCO08625.1 thiamine-monophosphate kinase [Desulfolithobacter dissulfuricans]
MREREMIQAISDLVGRKELAEGLIRSIGDDCAVISRTDRSVWLLSMDSLVEQVHFDLRFHPAYELGRKAVSVNVSDVAAMGGRPQFLLLSLGLTPDRDQAWFKEFMAGLESACREYGCLLIGGDTVSSPRALTLTLTIIGEQDREAVIYRSGARPGDEIWVSGELGLAAAGLDLFRLGSGLEDPDFKPLLARHLNPRARVELGLALAGSGVVRAMLDLSDGLATDLAHLCKESGVGGRVEARLLPGHPALDRAAVLLDRQPIDWMIRGGEDYELLFTAPPAAGKTIQTLAAGQNVPVSRIGWIVREHGVVLIRGDRDEGEPERIDFQGYEHC